MKVLLLTHHWAPHTHHSIYSGYERIAYYLGEYCDIDILTWKFGAINSNYSETLSVYRALTPPSDIFLERRLLMSLKAMVMSKNYDIVHSLYPIPGLFPSFKYPVITTIHTIYDINKNPWMWYYSKLQDIVIKKAKCVITVSSALKDILQDRHGEKDIIFIPHGIDITYFKPENKETDKINIKGSFSYIALTTGAYGTDFLFIEKLSEKFPDVLFIIVGKSYKSKSKNIKYLTNISDKQLKLLYNVSDIFLKPLRFATANNSVLEAMSLGKPIIIDAIPGVLDYLDEKCAYLVQTREEYPKIIRHALDNETERKLKGNQAREKAKREFSWDVVAKKTVEIVD